MLTGQSSQKQHFRKWCFQK